MTAAGAPPDGGWQGRRLKGPAAPLGSGRGGHLGRAVLQPLPVAGDGALGGGRG